MHNDFFAKGFCCKLSLFVPYIFRLSIQAKSSVRGDMDYDEVVSFLFMFMCEYVCLNFCMFSYFLGVGCDWQVWALAEVDRSIVSVTFSYIKKPYLFSENEYCIYESVPPPSVNWSL